MVKLKKLFTLCFLKKIGWNSSPDTITIWSPPHKSVEPSPLGQHTGSSDVEPSPRTIRRLLRPRTNTSRKIRRLLRHRTNTSRKIRRLLRRRTITLGRYAVIIDVIQHTSLNRSKWRRRHMLPSHHLLTGWHSLEVSSLLWSTVFMSFWPASTPSYPIFTGQLTVSSARVVVGAGTTHFKQTGNALSPGSGINSVPNLNLFLYNL